MGSTPSHSSTSKVLPNLTESSTLEENRASAAETTSKGRLASFDHQNKNESKVRVQLRTDVPSYVGSVTTVGKTGWLRGLCGGGGYSATNGDSIVSKKHAAARFILQNELGASVRLVDFFIYLLFRVSCRHANNGADYTVVA